VAQVIRTRFHIIQQKIQGMHRWKTKRDWVGGYVGGTGSNASMTFPFAGLHTSQKAKAGPDSCIACGAGNMVIQFIH